MPSPAMKFPEPQFNSPDRSFQRELNQRVSAYFRDNKISPQATLRMKLKAVGLYLVLFGLYASFFLVEQSFMVTVATASLSSAVMFLIGMNVMHDCAHGTLFKNPTLRRLSLCVWDFFGVSGDVYRTKHNDVHHKYTNVTGWDGDMDLSYPVLRLNPNLPLLPRHRSQHLYATLLYSTVTLSWIFVADFAAIFGRRVCSYEVKPFARGTIAKVIAFKILNLGLLLAIPSLFFPFWKVLLTFVYVQLLLGFMLALIFQVAHINEKAKFVRSESGEIANDWARHQLATSANFATDSAFWGFALGGLNYQIEHHLFPAISHAHYPAVRRILRDVCAEQGLEYNEFPTFRSAVSSHYRFLKALGR